MHSHKFIAMALVLAMVLTGMAVLMPTASAATVYHDVTDAPTSIEVGSEYLYPIDTSLPEWDCLGRPLRLGDSVTI